MQTCAICGCTELAPCVDPWDGEPHPCGWIDDDLCSACRYVPLGVQVPVREERVPAFAGVTIGPQGSLVCVADLAPGDY